MVIKNNSCHRKVSSTCQGFKGPPSPTEVSFVLWVHIRINSLGWHISLDSPLNWFETCWSPYFANELIKSLCSSSPYPLLSIVILANVLRVIFGSSSSCHLYIYLSFLSCCRTLMVVSCIGIKKKRYMRVQRIPLWESLYYLFEKLSFGISIAKMH